MMATLSYYLVERPLMKFKYRSPGDIFRGRSSGDRQQPIADAGGS